MEVSNKEYLQTFTGQLKLLEIIMIVITFAILRATTTLCTAFDEDAFYIGVGVTFASLIVTPLLLTCYLMDKMEIQQTILEFAVNFLFFFFYGVFSMVALIKFSNYQYGSERDSGIAMGVFALFASMAYLADSIFSIFNYVKLF